MRFSGEEANHLLFAWAALTFAFAVILSDGLAGISKDFPVTMMISGLVVGTGFILHEMAHKFVAQKYGCWAEFRRFDLGLAIAVGLSFVGFIFAAPGAVMISGFVSNKQNGYISAAGPVTNILLAVFFLVFGSTLVRMVISVSPGLVEFVVPFVVIAYSINAWLAFFNLIPFGPLDGAKVLNWSLPAWGILIAISGYLVFFQRPPLT